MPRGGGPRKRRAFSALWDTLPGDMDGVYPAGLLEDSTLPPGIGARLLLEDY